ncbi:MAG TPA: MFS transporter [Bryobacteraceae bacterium]|nr:MFS transporter [Bryobacteraceae bacterium]
MSRTRQGLLPFLGLASGASVATIYYNQPLLLEITRTFHISSGSGGAIAVATQLGYAVGILLFVPLGDVIERRKLILRLFAAVSLALATAGLAPSFWVLVAASVAIGVTAAVTHILVPIAPELAGPGQGGRAIGTVMTGLLLGVLLGRTASGAVAEALGWRAVFLLAAVVTGAFVPLLWWRMPALAPPKPLRYRAALGSLWDLVREQPVLREASTVSCLAFAGFISFWTNLAFLLGSPQYHLGAGVAGSFGLLGAAGALVASPAGRLADRHGPRATLTLALGLMSAAYVLLWVFGYHLAGLIAGVIVLDIGQQTMQISNQIRIFALTRTARSRVNTVYMIVFFLGGAMGSALSAVAWSRWQWSGVCAWGLLMLGLASLRHGFGSGARRPGDVEAIPVPAEEPSRRGARS